MRYFHRVYIRSTVFVVGRSRTAKLSLLRGLKKFRFVLQTESIETKQMLDIYYRHSRKQASAQELEWANKQFNDVLKTLGLGVLVVLPFAPLTFPLFVLLGKKLGVDILPDSFYKEHSDELPELKLSVSESSNSKSSE